IHFAVVTESECGLVKNSQQELPQRVVRFLDFIEENEAETSALRLILIDCFLCQERRCFAVAQITPRRTDQFRDFVTVLKLRAIDFDKGARTAKKDLGGGFDDSGLYRSRRSQKQEIPTRPVRHGPARVGGRLPV